MSNARRLRRAIARTAPTRTGLVAARAARAVAESAATVLDRGEPAVAEPAGEQVSNRAWSDFTQADYSLAQWHRACLIHRHDGEPTAKDQCSLPVREPSGRINRNGVHAAAARINQVDAPRDQIQRAARALVRIYRNELDEDPPESLLRLAGQASGEAVTEVGAIEAPRNGQRPGRMLVQLIRAGWSVNGRYYPAEVLRRDGPAAFPAGTQSFIDHATEEDDAERPAGSIRNLAGVLTTTARWDEDRQALVAEVRLFAPWRETLTDMAEHIGMSIRAWVTGGMGEAEGREGFIVESIVGGRSVDFVTVPAAGGRILSVLESAQPQPASEARNVGAWLESRLHLALTQLGDEMYGDGRLTRDERNTLSAAIGDALRAWTARVEADAPQLFERDLYDEPTPPSAEQPAEEVATDDTRAMLQRAVVAAYGSGEMPTWVLDFDPDRNIVWYSVNDRLWEQQYTIADGEARLLDGRVEVVRRVVFEPVTPAGESPAAGQPASDPAPAADAPPAAAAEPTEQPAVQVAPIPVAEMAAELARLDQLLGTADVPASAGAGQNAGGSPPTAHHVREETPMPGTQDGARAPDQAGTASEARTNTNPVQALEAQLAVLAQERDQFRARAQSLAEALTEAQSAQRRAEAERDAAVAEMRRHRANEVGRETVERLLNAPESGVPESMRAAFAPRVHAAIQDRVPLTDSGEVDQPALEAMVQTAIRAERTHAAQLLEAQGVGGVHGLGLDVDPGSMTRQQFEESIAAKFREIGLDETTTQLAVRGR